MSADDARRRFDAATALLLAPLPHGVVVRPCTPDEWDQHAKPWWRADARNAIDLATLYDDQQRASAADLDAVMATCLEHRVLLVAGDDVIGAYWGHQERHGRYYMVNSILDPAWRGRGVYTALLANVEAAARAAGFRELTSRHRADNNAVLVPKLRTGWVIAGFEISPRYGLLVALRKPLVETLGRLHAHRVDGSQAALLRAAGLPLP
jgi:ribosomal protein S18 acetylase RimI-like enzyme